MRSWMVTLDACDRALAIVPSEGLVGGPDVPANPLVDLDESTRQGGMALICMAREWGPVLVLTEALDREPPPPDNEWEDVVEFSLTASTPLAVSELVDRTPTPLTLTPGTFRIRVHGLGRQASIDPDLEDEENPSERYLLQAWEAPNAPPAIIRLTSEYAVARTHDAEGVVHIEGEAAAQAAARRIGADIDGSPDARALSGAVGALTVAREIPGTRKKLFTYFRLNFIGWASATGNWEEHLETPIFDFPPPDESEPLCGTGGSIRRIRIVEDGARRRVMKFAWILPQEGVRIINSSRQFPQRDTVVTIDWDQRATPDDGPITTVTVAHEGLPTEWVTDMTTWWSYHLALVEWHARRDRRAPA